MTKKKNWLSINNRTLLLFQTLLDRVYDNLIYAVSYLSHLVKGVKKQWNIQCMVTGVMNTLAISSTGVTGTTLKTRTAYMFSCLTSPGSSDQDELESFLPIWMYYWEFICLIVGENKHRLFLWADETRWASGGPAGVSCDVAPLLLCCACPYLRFSTQTSGKQMECYTRLCPQNSGCKNYTCSLWKLNDREKFKNKYKKFISNPITQK